MSNESKLLIHEPPLQVLPSLAVEIGLNEAIILQQIQYWLYINEKAQRNYEADCYWTYNTYEDWQAKNFPFWSVSTIKRTFSSLKKQGLIKSEQRRKAEYDRRAWVTINYDKLAEIEKAMAGWSDPEGQNDTVQESKVAQSTSTDTTSEKKTPPPKNTATGTALKNSAPQTDLAAQSDQLKYMMAAVEERYPNHAGNIADVAIMAADYMRRGYSPNDVINEPRFTPPSNSDPAAIVEPVPTYAIGDPVLYQGTRCKIATIGEIACGQQRYIIEAEDGSWENRDTTVEEQFLERLETGPAPKYSIGQKLTAIDYEIISVFPTGVNGSQWYSVLDLLEGDLWTAEEGQLSRMILNAENKADAPPAEEPKKKGRPRKKKAVNPALAKPDFWGDFVVEVQKSFGVPMGIALKLAEQLLGIAPDGERAEHNCEPPAQLGEAEKFVAWWRATQPGMTITTKADALAMWWYRFKNESDDGSTAPPSQLIGAPEDADRDAALAATRKAIECQK